MTGSEKATLIYQTHQDIGDKMPRYFEHITIPELREKIKESTTRKDTHSYAWPLDIPQVRKDLAKCDFDFENHSISSELWTPRRLMGLCTLNNGLTFWGQCAGGDWEFPVFFILYWDGKKVRGYVPREGNPWNKKTKMAFGNDESERTTMGELKFDVDKIEMDIRDRLKLRGT